MFSHLDWTDYTVGCVSFSRRLVAQFERNVVITCLRLPADVSNKYLLVVIFVNDESDLVYGISKQQAKAEDK